MLPIIAKIRVLNLETCRLNQRPAQLITKLPELVTAPEAARRLGVPREDVVEAICEGRLKAIRVRFGHRVLELVCAGALEDTTAC